MSGLPRGRTRHRRAHFSRPVAGRGERFDNFRLFVRIGQAFESGLLPLEVLVEAVRPVAYSSKWGEGGPWAFTKEDNLLIELSHVFNIVRQYM